MKDLNKIQKACLKYFALMFGFGGGFLSPLAAQASGALTPAAPLAIGPFLLGALLLVILAELGYVVVQQKKLTRLLKTKAEEKGVPYVSPWKAFLNSLTGKNTEEEVKKLDLQHDYDGIRELDNNIPGWWQMAFAGTIVIAVIYLFRMFVSGTLPDQVAELEQDQRIAQARIEAYLKESGNAIDENTVKLLTDPADLAAGADLYGKNCTACHGTQGEGGIGPNLTDKYWLHGGSISQVFYSIKYGWPDKGMKAWENDFAPMQIAQIASYIRSLEGTHPPNAKEPQGELQED